MAKFLLSFSLSVAGGTRPSQDSGVLLDTLPLVRAASLGLHFLFPAWLLAFVGELMGPQRPTAGFRVIGQGADEGCSPVSAPLLDSWPLLLCSFRVASSADFLYPFLCGTACFSS